MSPQDKNGTSMEGGGGESGLRGPGDENAATAVPGQPQKKRLGIFGSVFAFFSSFLLAATILFFLFIITLLGTLQQRFDPLYVVQRDYFESMYVLHPITQGDATSSGFLLPLPGGYLLMAVLFVNLLCGAIIRARKSWRRPGMVITHSSILLLIAAGAVSLYFKEEGHLSLYEDEIGNVAQTFRDWEIKIAEVDEKGEVVGGKYHAVPKEHFFDLEQGETRSFTNEKLPFKLRIDSFYRNCRVDPRQWAASSKEPPKNRDLVGEFYLKWVEETNEDMIPNVPGMTVTLSALGSKEAKGGSVLDRAILWGSSPYHHITKVGDKTYAITLGRRRFELPYSVRLEKFEAEFHPGTTNPKEFSSVVTKLEDGTEETSTVSMNKPLRSNGYTVYQTNWGPQPQGGPRSIDPNAKSYSVFEVATNPSDQWPLYACLIVIVGLSVHFGQMLLGYLKRTTRRLEREREAAAAAAASSMPDEDLLDPPR